jgi:hypothetical protein
MLEMMSSRQSVSKESRVPSRIVQRESDPADQGSPLHSPLYLQQTIGNQAVGRLMQAKLEMSKPTDQYEQEADRTADQVMRMRRPGTSPHSLAIEPYPRTRLQRKRIDCEEEALRAEPVEQEQESGLPLDIDMPIPGEMLEAEESPPPVAGTHPGAWLQRMCADCGKEMDLQAKETPGQAVVHDFQGGGFPLEASLRDFFEPRFGYAFDEVRVHTDARATEAARAVNSLAYTQGHDIVFGAGQYAPNTMAGRRLVAHELTHVMQQNASHGPTKSSGLSNGSVPVQAITSGSTMLQRKWVTGAPVAGVNTIVCDGKGGIRVQLGATGNAAQTACLSACMQKHEESHRADALAANAQICKGVSADRIVTIDTAAERKATEVKASNVEISCLKAHKADAKCEPIVKARISQMEKYRDSF